MSPPHLRAFPHNAVEYADALVVAWGRGDDQTVRRFAQPDVVHTLLAYRDPGGKHWRRTGFEGAAGTIYVTYHNDATGAQLVVAVTSQRASQARPHAVRSAKFS